MPSWPCPRTPGRRPCARTAQGARGPGWPSSPSWISPPGRPGRGRSAGASARTRGRSCPWSDHQGHRFQVLLTNQAGDPVALEARHRARARVEDAIRAAKDTGLGNLPFRDFAANAAWLELVLVAQDLVAWAQVLLLDGELARAEPKRLRYRLLHVAGRITRSGRRVRLHLPARWPWAGALVGAFARLRALPAPRVAARGPARGRGSAPRSPRAARARAPAAATGAGRAWRHHRARDAHHARQRSGLYVTPER